MKKGRFSDEQIVAALRDADASSVVKAARKHGVSEQSIHRWRKKFAGMEVSDVRELRRLRDENARAPQEAGCRARPRGRSDEGDSGKKVVSPRTRRAMARYAIDRGLTQRRAVDYRSKRERRDRHLSSALRIVARGDPGWGYRLAAGYLRLRGWRVNDKRVYRLWRLNGLCLPPYRPRRKIRTGAKLKGLALRRNDVWAWDFVHDRYHDSEPLRCLTVKDEATGYCLAIKVARHLQHQHVKALLHELITRYGRPRAIRSDNGPEFLGEAFVDWCKAHGILIDYIEPGKPNQNAYIERFNRTYRDEVLDTWLFRDLDEVRELSWAWMLEYNEERDHDGLGGMTPAEALKRAKVSTF
jgi:putative transposase